MEIDEVPPDILLSAGMTASVSVIEPKAAEPAGRGARRPYLRENFRQAAGCVDRTLEGARIADLSLVQASRFELLLLDTAAAKFIGLMIPPTLLIRVDEVIE